MPLRPQRVNLPLFGGPQDDVVGEVLGPPSMRRQYNVRYDKEGRTRRRYGYDEINPAISGLGANLANATRLMSRDSSELLVADNQWLYSRINTASEWKRMDRVPPVANLERRPVSNIYQAGNISNQSIAYTNGYVCVTWQDQRVPGPTNQVNAVVIDQQRREVISQISFTTASNPKVISVNNLFIVCWSDTAAAQVQASKFDTDLPTTWSSSTGVNLVTDLEAANSSNFDIAGNNALGTFYVAYIRTAAGRQLDIREYTASTLAATGDTALNIDGAACLKPTLHLAANGATLFVAYWDNVDTRVECRGRDPADLTEDFGERTISAGGVEPQYITIGARGNNAWVVWSYTQVGVATAQYTQWRGISTAGAVDANGPWSCNNLKLASRPFEFNSRTYVAVVSRELQPAYNVVLLDIGDSANAWVSAGNAGNFYGSPCGVWMVGDIKTSFNTVLSAMVTGVSRLDQFGFTEATEIYGAFALSDFNIGGFIRGSSVEQAVLSLGARNRFAGFSAVGRDLYLPGAQAYCYDGELCFEAAFSYTPWIEDSAIAGGGSLDVDTVYSYRVVYEWQDRQGRVWKSKPSPVPTTLNPNGRETTNAGNRTITLTIPHYSLTAMQDSDNTLHPVSIVVYRKNETIGDTTWVRLAKVGTGDFDPSDRTVNTFFTFTDNGSTYTTTNQPEIYTTGGVLENDPPRPSCYSVIFDGRVFNVCADNPRALQYSREIIEREGVAFSEAQFISTPDDGDLVGLAVMDAYLILLKKNAIYWMQGVGPDDTGQNLAYTTPQKISTDRGCVDSNSIVVTPDGVYFRSDRGIELLNRSLTVEFKGGPVEDSLDLYPVVTSAILNPADSEVRFTTMGGGVETDTGLILKYNYEFDRWSVDELFTDDIDDPPFVQSAIYYKGFYYWADFGGRVCIELKEGINAYSDHNFLGSRSYVTYSFTTPHYKLDELQGFVRVWRGTLFGKSMHPDPLESPGLFVEVFHDYGSTPAFTYTISTGEIAEQSNFPIIQARLEPATQRCQAIQFKISETIPSASAVDRYNAGIAWSGLMLEYGVEPKATGRFKSTANK